MFTDLALKLGRPWLERVEGAFPRLGRAASWALVSTCCIATSFVVAWVVPEFDLVSAWRHGGKVSPLAKAHLALRCTGGCPCSTLCIQNIMLQLPRSSLQVIAVIAAVGSVAAPYMLPALFGLALLADLHPVERWLLKTIVPVRWAWAPPRTGAKCLRVRLRSSSHACVRCHAANTASEDPPPLPSPRAAARCWHWQACMPAATALWRFWEAEGPCPAGT